MNVCFGEKLDEAKVYGESCLRCCEMISDAECIDTRFGSIYFGCDVSDRANYLQPTA